MFARRNSTCTCISATVKAGRRQARPDRRYNVISDIFRECVCCNYRSTQGHIICSIRLKMVCNANHNRRLEDSSIAQRQTCQLADIKSY